MVDGKEYDVDSEVEYYGDYWKELTAEERAFLREKPRPRGRPPNNAEWDVHTGKCEKKK